MDNIDILKKAGLSDAQAEVYDCLLKNGAMTPAELGEKTSQSRENCYAIVKKLTELELVEQTNDKKTSFRVLNPSNLEILVEKRRKIMARNEKAVKDNISSLLDTFYANNDLPGSRTLEGIEGIEEMYMDMLRVKKDIYMLRTRAAYDIIGTDEDNGFLKKYREQLPILGIHTYALTSVYGGAVKKHKNGRDDATLFHRVWMPEEDYTAPVSIHVYGDKVSFASYSGNVPMAVIITSPIVAESMRQTLKIMMNFYKKNFPQDQK